MTPCARLKALIESLPDGPLKAALQAVYDAHCAGSVEPQDGGGGGGGPPVDP